MDLSVVLPLVVAALVAACVAWVVATARYAGPLAAARAETALLRRRESELLAEVEHLREVTHDDRETAAALAPLREAMGRLERHVGVLERDRLTQYATVAERLTEVSQQAGALGRQTATLAGALNASTVRGAWGEAQLRRVCEHAGMIPHCDFDEQVSGVTSHEAAVRPDLVVRLPGGRCLVVDAKAPLSSFLAAQADGVTGERRRELLAEHARALRGHVESLAAKRYWSAFVATPEMVVCFVPADAMLAAALSADPGLYDHAQSRKVVLASPATVLALLRTVAFAWRQEAVESNARELLRLGEELYERVGTLGQHLSRMGGSLRRSVEAYNALVGSVEGRVLVSARKMHGLGVGATEVTASTPVEVAPRPLTAVELIDCA